MEQIDNLIKQRELLNLEIIKAVKSECMNPEPFIKALELNNEIILKLLDKPVETTNEQPIFTCNQCGLKTLNPNSCY